MAALAAFSAFVVVAGPAAALRVSLDTLAEQVKSLVARLATFEGENTRLKQLFVHFSRDGNENANTACGLFSSVSGGLGNTVGGFASSVSGAQHSIASGSRSAAGGGGRRKAEESLNWAGASFFTPQ